MNPDYIDATWKRAVAEAHDRRRNGTDAPVVEPVLSIFARLVRDDVRRETLAEVAADEARGMK